MNILLTHLTLLHPPQKFLLFLLFFSVPYFCGLFVTSPISPTIALSRAFFPYTHTYVLLQLYLNIFLLLLPFLFLFLSYKRERQKKKGERENAPFIIGGSSIQQIAASPKKRVTLCLTCLSAKQEKEGREREEELYI